MQGKIFSGDKKATKIMQDYLDKFKSLFGKDFFLGTLNIKLEEDLDTSDWKFLERFKTPETERGGVWYKKGKLNGEEVIFIRPEFSHYQKNIIEAISNKNLRDTLNLKDEDRVEISI